MLGPGRATAEALVPWEGGDSGVTRRSSDPGEAPDSAREAREVKQRVEGMLADAQVRHREATLGFDTDAVELGRTFEHAAVVPPEGPERTWIQAGLAAYQEELGRRARHRLPSVTPVATRESTWEDRVAVAREHALHASGYVAIVEVRQRADGRLAQLRLLASSGVRAFDERALGCVARGLESTKAPEGGQRLALWELAGKKLPDSKLVEGAEKAYRIAMLDVVPLKETIVELEREGAVERLNFTARLLAVY